MTWRSGLVAYAIALPVFFAIDMVWLGWLSGDLYSVAIGHLLGPVNWYAAALFYLLFIAGIVLFGVRPGLAAQSVRLSLIWGALYGFFTYATYDLTNMATLKGWVWHLVIIDIIWGVILCSSVSAITCVIKLKTEKRDYSTR